MDAFAANPPIRRRIPSLRNRQVFEEVVVKDRFKTDVAAQFGLTQPRVSQIVEQVEDWLRQVVSPDGDDWPAEQRLRYAQNVTQLRLDSQLKETMAGWELSKKDKVVRRDSFSPTGELRGWTLTTSNQCGKSSHINQALNLSLALARLAGVDVTGKSIRDEIMRQEKLARVQAASPAVVPDFESPKPLWNSEPKDDLQQQVEVQVVHPTPLFAESCDDVSDASVDNLTADNSSQNSYEFLPDEVTDGWKESSGNAWDQQYGEWKEDRGHAAALADELAVA